jgi:hypothetical protein
VPFAVVMQNPQNDGGMESHVSEKTRTIRYSIELHIAMCKTLHMATNLALDDKLIEEVVARLKSCPSRSFLRRIYGD